MSSAQVLHDKYLKSKEKPLEHSRLWQWKKGVEIAVKAKRMPLTLINNND